MVDDTVLEGDDTKVMAPMPQASNSETEEKTPAADKALIDQWVKKIQASEKHFDKDFKRMRHCRQLAKEGASKDWAKMGKYVVPIVSRHIDQQVSALYAKNPKAYVTRKRRLMFQIWDGKPSSLQQALQGAMMGDPMSMQLIDEVMSVKQYNEMLDKMAETLVIVWDYFTSEQQAGFKAQVKTTIRRTKVDGVGIVKLNFQRVLETLPEITAKIDDVASKIAAMENSLAKVAEGELMPDMAEYSQLKFSMADLQNQETIIAREGPVYDFPRADEVIIDRNCRHLKSLAGADWIAHKFEKTCDEIYDIWKVKVDGAASTYTRMTSEGKTDSEDPKAKTHRVYEVWDRKHRQRFVICEGFGAYLEAPHDPEVYVDGFFPFFFLVFNEVDMEDELYPESDVWKARHIQEEYNRSREGLREHRIANRPYYVTPKGRLETEDLNKLGEHEAHEIIEVVQLAPNEDIGKVVQRGPSAPIDPNQYEVEMHFSDMQRVVGAQEANLGGTSGATATESAIAQQSSSVSMSDHTDEIDDLLSRLAKATGHLCLQQLSKETVLEIAGPGCIWPQTALAREELSKDLLLDIRAGSSGRPNKAAELANMERAMPFLTMLPGVNPEPLAKRYMDLIDIDFEDAMIEGLPSISAMNAMMSAVPTAGGRPDAQTANGADPTADPTQQGDAGAQNAPQPDPSGNGQPGFNTEQPLM